MTWHAQLLQQLINGLTIGMIYALIALGYTMVYGIIKLINFAHGEIFMVGGFIGYTILVAAGVAAGSTSLPLPLLLLLPLIVAMVGCGALGVGIERLAYKPLRRAPRLAALITALGMSLVLQNIAMLIYGAGPRPLPQLVPEREIHLGGAVLTPLQLIIIALALALMGALHWFIKKTRTGMSLRAVSQDRKGASLMGINVDRTISLCFLIGSCLGGAGGFIYGIYYAQISFSDGYLAGLKAFTAAVVGGIGNIPGAMLGGLIIGVAETLGAGYISSAWKDVFAFVILVVLLLTRPTGLIGPRGHES